MNSTRHNHIQPQPTKGCSERVLIFTACRHTRYSWNYYRSMSRQSTPLRRPESQPSATEMIKKHIAVSCKTIDYHRPDIVGRIDSIIRSGEGWGNCRFPIFWSNSCWKIYDLEVATARRWDPNPHTRPKQADAWLSRPVDMRGVGWIAVDWVIRWEVLFYSWTWASKSKSFAFSSTTPLLLTLPAENIITPLGGHPVRSRASTYP